MRRRPNLNPPKHPLAQIAGSAFFWPYGLKPNRQYHQLQTNRYRAHRQKAQHKMKRESVVAHAANKRAKANAAKLSRIPVPEVQTYTSPLNYQGVSSYDIDIVDIAGGHAGDTNGRSGAQVKVLRVEWHFECKEQDDPFTEIPPTRFTIYSVKDDATAVSNISKYTDYDHDIYNVYLDKWVTAGNVRNYATGKGAITLHKNMRWSGGNGTNHVTPPIRVKWINTSQFELKGYVRVYYVDK